MGREKSWPTIVARAHGSCVIDAAKVRPQAMRDQVVAGLIPCQGVLAAEAVVGDNSGIAA